MILSGSSESGKTYFAGQLLERQDLFEDQIEAVVYYNACYLSKPLVEWHKRLDSSVRQDLKKCFFLTDYAQNKISHPPKKIPIPKKPLGLEKALF